MDRVAVTKCPPAYDPSLEYDSFQFSREAASKDMMHVVDWADAQRMQIFTTSAEPKEIPAWVRDVVRLEEVLMDHPQAEKLAPKWSKILYLYYFKQYTARDVSEEMGLTRKSVQRTIEQLNQRARSGD